jgi:hypothetical protein
MARGLILTWPNTIEEVRSQNFQVNFVKYFDTIKEDFQIIYTTSMIPKELDIKKYTVGDSYTSKNKSLKI